jgi:hypothetical protein
MAGIGGMVGRSPCGPGPWSSSPASEESVIISQASTACGSLSLTRCILYLIICRRFKVYFRSDTATLLLPYPTDETLLLAFR